MVPLARHRGSPQGSAISPLLANLFMHYAFDAWMAREFPTVRFERYATMRSCTASQAASACRADAIVERLARSVWSSSRPRRASCTARTQTAPAHTSTSSSRSLATRSVPDAAEGSGDYFVSFSPAVVNDAARRSVAGSSAGGCTCGAGSPSPTSHARSTRSCVAGPTITDASTRPSSARLSGASTTTWCVGPCGNTSGCEAPRTDVAAAREVARREPDLFAHWTMGAQPQAG